MSPDSDTATEVLKRQKNEVINEIITSFLGDNYVTIKSQNEKIIETIGELNENIIEEEKLESKFGEARAEFAELLGKAIDDIDTVDLELKDQVKQIQEKQEYFQESIKPEKIDKIEEEIINLKTKLNAQNESIRLIPELEKKQITSADLERLESSRENEKIQIQKEYFMRFILLNTIIIVMVFILFLGFNS